MNWDHGLLEILKFKLPHFQTFVSSNNLLQSKICFKLLKNEFKWTNDTKELDNLKSSADVIINHEKYNTLKDHDIYNALKDIYKLFSNPSTFEVHYSNLDKYLDITVKHNFGTHLQQVAGIAKENGLVTELKGHMNTQNQTLVIETCYLIVKDKQLIFKGQLEELLDRVL